jgi:DNA-binding FrmR family transcriptional regulator
VAGLLAAMNEAIEMKAGQVMVEHLVEMVGASKEERRRKMSKTHKVLVEMIEGNHTNHHLYIFKS